MGGKPKKSTAKDMRLKRNNPNAGGKGKGLPKGPGKAQGVVFPVPGKLPGM